MSTVGTRGGRHHGLLAALVSMLMAAVLGASDVAAVEAPVNDYPTVARADYIFGCMAANGQTRTSLEKCSCSIDVIASVLPYKAYEEAETIMSVRQRGGQNASMFISMPVLREKVARLKRAQIEGELRCF